MPTSIFDYGAIRARLYQLGERATFLRPIPHRILVVDDQQEMVELLSAWLEREGHVVSGARDGYSALAKVEAAEPDLILLDTMMPNLHGWEVCRRLKADPAMADIPIIMMPGCLDDERLSFEAGADDCFVKPFRLAEITARTHELLG